MANIILYDLPSKDPCGCWSLNPWKTRMALNYKGVDYNTEWVEYPDIASKFKELYAPLVKRVSNRHPELVRCRLPAY